MAATNYTPISLYYSTTASAVPVNTNLVNGELAINITDGKLFYKDNGGTVQVLATKGAGTIGGSNTQVQYNNSGALAGSANLTFNGTTLTANTLNLTNALGTTYGGTGLTSFTANGVVYASSSSALTTGSALTFDGTNFATSNSMRVTGSTASYASGAGTEITYIAGSTKGGIQVYDRTASAYKDVFLDGSNALFQISGTEKMRLDSSGNLGIGTTPNASAILDAQSTTKGVRMPNMTTTQKNAIASPAAGLMVFDTTLSKLCVYSGSAWQTITSV
jgi:hypothetical protein